MGFGHRVYKNGDPRNEIIKVSKNFSCYSKCCISNYRSAPESFLNLKPLNTPIQTFTRSPNILKEWCWTKRGCTLTLISMQQVLTINVVSQFLITHHFSSSPELVDGQLTLSNREKSISLLDQVATTLVQQRGNTSQCSWERWPMSDFEICVNSWF